MTIQKRYLGAIAMLFFVATAGAQSELTASEDLSLFSQSAGDYVVDPTSGPYCTHGYTALNVRIDTRNQTVVQTFTGQGEIHGAPTAGQVSYRVSLTDTIDLPSFPGSKKQRTVVSQDSIVTQTWTWSPLGGEFGGWKDDATIIRFVDDNRLMYARQGFNCPFVRVHRLMD